MTNMPALGGADSYRILVADDEQAVLDAYRTVIDDINPPFARLHVSREIRHVIAVHRIFTADLRAHSPGSQNHNAGARIARLSTVHVT